MSRKKERNITHPYIKNILESYTPDSVKDSESVYRWKVAINNLPEVDKIVFILYTELQSYTELSRCLGISRSSCFWMIRRIREELKGRLNPRF